MSTNQNFNNLEIVFKTLERAHRKIQLDKCEFFQTEVPVLGFLISKEGIKTNAKKVLAISNLGLPKTEGKMIECPNLNQKIKPSHSTKKRLIPSTKSKTH